MADLVMVIEDEKEIRDLVRYNLERAGFRVNAFADGEEGLERLFASRPDAAMTPSARLGCARRSRALRRATSSRGLKGLVR